MRTTFRSVISVTALGITLALANSSQAQVIFHPPRVVVSPPAMIAPVPDFYVWDGREFVGMVGNQYFFLGPGNLWMPMDPVRMRRFNTWSRSNPNWRARATRNTRYRRGGPMRGGSTRSAGPPPRHPASNGPPSNQNQGRSGNRGQGNRGSGNRGSGNQGSGNQGSGNRGQNNPPQ